MQYFPPGSRDHFIAMRLSKPRRRIPRLRLHPCLQVLLFLTAVPHPYPCVTLALRLSRSRCRSAVSLRARRAYHHRRPARRRKGIVRKARLSPKVMCQPPASLARLPPWSQIQRPPPVQLSLSSLSRPLEGSRVDLASSTCSVVLFIFPSSLLNLACYFIIS
jgi:hypothetical protein